MNEIKDAFDAVKTGDAAKLETLLSAKPDLVHAQTPFGPLLHVAASNGHVSIMALLLDHGANIDASGGTFGGTALNQAASANKLESVDFLLRQGAQMDVSEPERNPLFGAIYAGSLDIVKLLIQNGINTSVSYTGQFMKNMDAKTFALERGQKTIAEFLSSGMI